MEHLLVLTLKILQGEAPIPLSELFTISENVKYDLPNNNNMLTLPKPKTNAIKKAFSYKAARVWNTLPLSLEDIKLPINTFKKNLREFWHEKDNNSIRQLHY